MYEIGDMYEIGAQPYYAYGLAPGGLGMQTLQPFAQPGRMMTLAPAGVQAGASTMPSPAVGMAQPLSVRKVDPTNARLQALGMNSSSTIAAGAASVSGDIQVQPQKVCKPRRYTVSPSIAPDFIVNSLTIGVQPQSPAITAISAEAFLPTCTFSEVDYDTCQISQQIAALVTNINASAARQYLSTFYVYVLQV